MSTNQVRRCEDALRLLAAHLDRELDSAADLQVARHLETCLSCYSRAEFERRLKASLAGLGRSSVPPALDQRVRTLIREFSVAADG